MDLPTVDGLWDYRDPAGSQRRFEALLECSDAAVEPGWHVETLSQLARAVCLQRRFDEAHAILDRAEPLHACAGERAQVRVCLERGRIHNDTGRTEDAMTLFAEALERAEAAGEIRLAADALHMLAYVARGEESLRWHRRALEFCAQHDDERMRRWEVTLHTNMADEYERQGDFASGRRAIERSLAAARALGLEDTVCGARVFLARLHRLDGDVDQAWTILQGVFDPQDPRGFAHEEYAECLLAMGRVEAARPHFRRAFERLSKDPWFPPGEVERLARLERLGAEGDPA